MPEDRENACKNIPFTGLGTQCGMTIIMQIMIRALVNHHFGHLVQHISLHSWVVFERILVYLEEWKYPWAKLATGPQ